MTATKHVLVVDSSDDDQATQRLSTMLALQGHRVYAAHSATHAVSIANEQALDLVMLGLELPDRDRSALARALRSSARSRDVPLVVLSASDAIADFDGSRASGVLGFMPKPVDYFSLRALLEHLAPRSQASHTSGDPAGPLPATRPRTRTS